MFTVGLAVIGLAAGQCSRSATEGALPWDDPHYNNAEPRGSQRRQRQQRTETSLSVGFCDTNIAAWSIWRSEDGQAGHADYEGISRHKFFRMDYFQTGSTVDPRLVCDNLYAIEARVNDNGAGFYNGKLLTDQVVRFGFQQNFRLETCLNLCPSYWNVQLGDEWKDIDDGLICWNEEQPGSETVNCNAGFNANSCCAPCYQYEIRWCCDKVVEVVTDLNAGTCTTGTWSSWREEDGPSGYADFEALSWHDDDDGNQLDCPVVQARVRNRWFASFELVNYKTRLNIT